MRENFFEKILVKCCTILRIFVSLHKINVMRFIDIYETMKTSLTYTG